jgi:hypothetical protein
MKSKISIAASSGIKNYLKDNNLIFGDLVIAIGSKFIDVPYQASTLESPDGEKLVICMSGFDCITFVETTLAVARRAISGRMTPAELAKNLKSIRYRGGIISGYSSRLHYFTDWLRDNEEMKILKDITRHFKAGRQQKEINYMTLHRSSFPALERETEFRKMRLVEENLSRKTFYILDKKKADSKQRYIDNGDIIAFTTDEDGLDVTHVGFALWRNGKLHLLHASKEEGRVVISRKTLVAYLNANKKFSGIIIARPK